MLKNILFILGKKSFKSIYVIEKLILFLSNDFLNFINTFNNYF